MKRIVYKNCVLVLNTLGKPQKCLNGRAIKTKTPPPLELNGRWNGKKVPKNGNFFFLLLPFKIPKKIREDKL